MVSFYTPRKHQNTRGFLMFSGGIERDQWHEMSLERLYVLTAVEERVAYDILTCFAHFKHNMGIM